MLRAPGLSSGVHDWWEDGAVGLTLGKYEALGNDFLCVIDPGRSGRFDADLARSLCDRRRGVGADGLLRVSVTGNELAMELLNADGSAAETSGNGLRCCVLAALHAGLVPPGTARLAVHTAVGRVEAVVHASDEGGRGEIEVGMGELAVQALADSPVTGRRALFVDVGNPHLVLLDEGAPVPVDLTERGPALEASRPGGVNVEVVDVLDATHCRLSVYERGAGLTLACGSGSCAAAAAGRALGRLGDEVSVENPGGSLTVRLSGPLEHPSASLRGPARRVARIEVAP